MLSCSLGALRGVCDAQVATNALLDKYKREVESLKKRLASSDDSPQIDHMKRELEQEAKHASVNRTVLKMKSALLTEKRSRLETTSKGELDEMKAKLTQQRIANMWQRGSYAAINKKLQVPHSTQLPKQGLGC
jgi:hypothetical protein